MTDQDVDYAYNTPSEDKVEQKLPARPRKVTKRRRRVIYGSDEELVDTESGEESVKRVKRSLASEFDPRDGEFDNHKESNAISRAVYRSLGGEFDRDVQEENEADNEESTSSVSNVESDQDNESEYDRESNEYGYGGGRRAYDGPQKKPPYTNVKPTYFQAKYYSPHREHYHRKCPSTKDECTGMDLPRGKGHVCCVTKEGGRHCYALDTIYRESIEKQHNAKKDSSASASPRADLQFLQPPAFNVPMKDDLIDQIAVKFGRSALDIKQSSVYTDMKRIIGYHMGSRDLYCCPICYTEADRRGGNVFGEMANDDDESIADSSESDEMEEEMTEEDNSFSFQEDPMTILTNIQYEQEMRISLASTFCFEKLNGVDGVKKHVQVVHNVDPSIMKGNGLFQRFQIRATDGLLQRWLRESNPGHTVEQREMWDYWIIDGNSESFKQLVKKVHERHLKLLKQDGEGNDGGKGHIVCCGSSFSKSFPNRAKNLWRKLTAPYLKSNDNELEDMIDDDVGEEGCKPRPVLDVDQELDPEELIVDYCRQKNGEGIDDSDDEAEETSSVSAPSSGNVTRTLSREYTRRIAKSLIPHQSISVTHSSYIGIDTNNEADWEAGDLMRRTAEDFGVICLQAAIRGFNARKRVEKLWMEEADQSKDAWLRRRELKPSAARARKRSDSGSDDSLFNSDHIASSEKNKVIVDTDDESDQVQPNVISPERKKKVIGDNE